MTVEEMLARIRKSAPDFALTLTKQNGLVLVAGRCMLRGKAHELSMLCKPDRVDYCTLAVLAACVEGVEKK